MIADPPVIPCAVQRFDGALQTRDLVGYVLQLRHA